jgi:hypothetical protein
VIEYSFTLKNGSGLPYRPDGRCRAADLTAPPSAPPFEPLTSG